MLDLEQICFNMISHVGTARSSYIEAVQKAKEGDYDGAEACIAAGQEEYLKGHNAHFELIAGEAGGDHINVPLLLVHAEDQMMSAEAFHIMAQEMIAIYREMDEIKKKVQV